MSPRDKRWLALISVVACGITIFCLALYYIPTYLYIIFIFVVSCVACYYNTGELPLLARLGLNPRRGLTVPPAFLRWLPGTTLSGVPTTGRNNRSRTSTSNATDTVVSPGERHFASSVYRRDATFSNSLFSPRDVLMGSYLGKPESPGAGRPVVGGANPREQLRERLSRPNHGVYTPNRRLSFGGEPLGTVGRFTITPQRHYPVQQTGASSLGVLPPAQWDGFHKKNILTPRNSPAVHSPVTVKIARPDHIAASFFDHLNSSGATVSPGLGAPADPCSRESVLSVLRDSRKREVDEEEDRGHPAGLKSKRRRHDSSGSSHSAFEPLLANGAPSQLMPKPGSMKRGLNASVVAEESMTKRSRASSISSVSGGQTMSGVLGSVRNSIRSSYSSSQGYAKRKVASSLSLSPLTSPGSSRSQTPERASKKPREEDAASPSSASSVRSDWTATDLAPATGRFTPAPEAAIATALSASGGSGGKRKRKIQLVSTWRGDHISLPPPPELGYTITVKDLDMEKKAALNLIQKVLEEPGPAKPVPAPSADVFSQPATTTSGESTPAMSTPALALVATSTPPESTPSSATAVAPAPALVIDLQPAPLSTVSAAPTPNFALAASLANPLLESLRSMKSSSPLLSASALAAAATTAAPAIPVMTAAIAPAEPRAGAVKREPALTAVPPSIRAPPPAYQPATSATPTSMPSAFAQILAQPLAPLSSTSTLGAANLFSLGKPMAAPAPASSATTDAASSISNSLMFKPIFGALTTAPAATAPGPEPKPAAPAFTALFGSAASAAAGAFAQPASVPAAGNASVFSRLSGPQAAPASVPSSTAAAATSAPVKSLFGSFGTPLAATNSSFQFGATSTTAAAPAPTTSTTISSNTNTFQFGAIKPSATPQPAPQPTPQSTFTFGQPAAGQNSVTTATFSQNSNVPTTAFGQNSVVTTAAFGQNSNVTTATFGHNSNVPTTTFGQNSVVTTATFGGFSMPSTTAAADAPTTQAAFGAPSFTASSSFPSAPQPSAAKPFAFGAGGGTGGAAPFTFGTAATTAAATFGTASQSVFGNGGSSGFSFGNTTAPSAAPAFGSATQTAAPPAVPAPNFNFGGASAAPQIPSLPVQSTPAQTSTGGFNFGAALSGAQFGTPNPTTQTPGFNFGASNTDNKPAFGTSTPAFGQSSAGGPIAFGSPGTPGQGFSALPSSSFGTPPATFSIGASSKPSGARQRLQARRQHVRKK